MKSATYTIKNKLGIHARPAADIAWIPNLFLIV